MILMTFLPHSLISYLTPPKLLADILDCLKPEIEANMNIWSKDMYKDLSLVAEFTSYPLLHNILFEDWL